MDLVLPNRIETNVTRSCLAADAECHTVSASRTPILIGVQVETAKIDLPIVDSHTNVVSVSSIPTVDLVEVELQNDRLCIAWDALVYLVGVLTRSTVQSSIPSKELGEVWCSFEAPIPPSQQ